MSRTPLQRIASKYVLARLFICSALFILPPLAQAQTEPAVSAVVAKNLLREAIAGADGKEVIVSRVSFPPDTQLAWHWHPGEEFFYVMQGAVVLKRRGQPDQLASAGDAQKIAAEVIHTGLTGEEGAELVIFRVHSAGEPERYLVD